MSKTILAAALATLVVAAVPAASQAAPIAPLSGVSSTAGSVTPVYWYGYHRHYGWHRHCWRGRWGRLHCW